MQIGMLGLGRMVANEQATAHEEGHPTSTICGTGGDPVRAEGPLDHAARQGDYRAGNAGRREVAGQGDVLFDGGDAHFKDSRRRAAWLADTGQGQGEYASKLLAKKRAGFGGHAVQTEEEE